jgi:hypothetical protein
LCHILKRSQESGVRRKEEGGRKKDKEGRRIKKEGISCSWFGDWAQALRP